MENGRSTILRSRPAFGCCAHPEAGQNTFFEPFSTFFVHFKPFFEQKKTVFYFVNSSKLVDKCWSTPWGGTSHLSFLGDFQMFFLDFRREITEKSLKLTKKSWKQLKKVFQPAFGCTQHPKLVKLHNIQVSRICLFLICSLVCWTVIVYSIIMSAGANPIKLFTP